MSEQNSAIDEQIKHEEFNTEVPFSISARVIYQLGEQLISNEYVALAELIKNSYDADCTIVTIHVDTKVETEYGRGRIEIIDNGNGMTRTILEKSFLKISTNFKCVEKFSPFFKRRSLGEKGLGRLSIQRLGDYMELVTTPRLDRLEQLNTIIAKQDIEFHKNYNTASLNINWKDFMSSNKEFSDIITKCRYSNTDNPIYGTRLIISGIRNIDFWKLDGGKKTAIRSEIFGMVNPFIQQSDEKFDIELIIDGLRFSNRKIDENVLKIMSDITVDFVFEDWIVKLKIIYRKKYLERLQQRVIDNMYSRGFKKFNILSHCESYVEEYILDLSNEKYKLQYPFLEHIALQSGNRLREDLAYPGNFTGTFYAADQSVENLKIMKYDFERAGYTIKTQKELKSIWDAAKGVYLFRNNFRILPYGPDIDWLAFTARSQRIKQNSYKNHTVSGYVHVESLSSENLIEQTDRQGLIQDEYGSNFLTLMRDVIAYIAFRSDVVVRDGYTTPDVKDDLEIRTRNGKIVFYKSIDAQKKKQDLISEIKVASHKIISQSIDSTQDIKQETEDIKDKIEELTIILNKEEEEHKQRSYEYEKRLDYFKSLIGLAGQSIIIESLTHELHRIEENINTYTETTLDELEELEKKASNIDLEPLIENQDNILNQLDYMKEQLGHLEPTYKRNRLLVETIKIKEFLKNTYTGKSPMAKKASKYQIDVVIKGEEFSVQANKGMLITIFDNLFLNSLYWLPFSEKHGGVLTKEIHFELLPNTSSIQVWDTGVGVHPEIEESLFFPEKSMKENGRGLGLFIVKELMNYLNADIKLNKNSRNKQGNLYKFILSFNEGK